MRGTLKESRGIVQDIPIELTQGNNHLEQVSHGRVFVAQVHGVEAQWAPKELLLSAFSIRKLFRVKKTWDYGSDALNEKDGWVRDQVPGV